MSSSRSPTGRPLAVDDREGAVMAQSDPRNGAEADQAWSDPPGDAASEHRNWGLIERSPVAVPERSWVAGWVDAAQRLTM